MQNAMKTVRLVYYFMEFNEVSILFQDMPHRREHGNPFRAIYDEEQLVIILVVYLSVYEKRHGKRSVLMIILFKLLSLSLDRSYQTKTVETHSSQGEQA